MIFSVNKATFLPSLCICNPVSGTGKSSESLFPKSLSMASSIATVAETVRDKPKPRLSIASTRSIDVKNKSRKVCCKLYKHQHIFTRLIPKPEKHFQTITKSGLFNCRLLRAPQIDQLPNVLSNHQCSGRRNASTTLELYGQAQGEGSAAETGS